MKRTEIVESLIKEGFSEKTLVKFSDKQLSTLANRVLGESLTTTLDAVKKSQALQAAAKDPNQNIKLVGEEKPSAGLSKKKKSEVVKKAKKGEDIGKKGKGFEKIVKKAKESGAEDPEAVAASAMWKNIKREGVEIKNWVKQVTNENFHSFTSKNEIMEMIQFKLQEAGPNVKIGHNGTPEFMTYEQAPAPSKPGTDAPVREKPTTKPGKPKRENPFEPKHNPKPKAEGNDTLPEFLKFDKLGIKFKNSK